MKPNDKIKEALYNTIKPEARAILDAIDLLMSARLRHVQEAGLFYRLFQGRRHRRVHAKLRHAQKHLFDRFNTICGVNGPNPFD